MDNTFLPKNYNIPQGNSGKYMRLVKGDNRFRKLANSTPRGAILGYEVWTEVDGKRTPKRYKMDESIPAGELSVDEAARHFMAFKVWNYAEERVQVLELTQKSIMKVIKKLAENPAWGNPEEYDIVITKTGEGKTDTRYDVQPNPKNELDKGIVQLDQDTPCDLTKLYTNGDPFATE